MVSSTWTFEDFKAAISDDVSSPPISEINLKVFCFSCLNFRATDSDDVSFS